jgi:hypothetical protein
MSKLFIHTWSRPVMINLKRVSDWLTGFDFESLPQV